MQLPLNLVRFCAAFCYFVLRVQDILIQNASKLMMLMSFSIQIQRGFRTIALHPAQILRGILLFCTQNSEHFSQKCIGTHEVDELFVPNSREISCNCPSICLGLRVILLFHLQNSGHLSPKCLETHEADEPFEPNSRGFSCNCPSIRLGFCTVFC